MQDYQKAPYLELENYKPPKGLNPIYIPMKDGKKIRLFFWNNIAHNRSNKGTVLLQQGHNEFIEKYYETIQEFLDRGYNVICFDWRGQGLSEKMIDNKNKQYIEDFSFYDEDLQEIVENFINNNFPRPLIGIGHSMGGCIIFSSLKKNEEMFDKIILSAPMLGFRNERFLLPFINFTNLFFSKYNYMIGSKPNMGKETPFEENELTSDPKRYNRTLKLVSLNPNIRLWGITNSWAKAAKKRLLYLREKNWAEEIKTEILFINSLDDKVVSPEQIISTAKRLQNAKIVNFQSVMHEIFMEKDIYRNKLWNEIDDFVK